MVNPIFLRLAGKSTAIILYFMNKQLVIVVVNPQAYVYSIFSGPNVTVTGNLMLSKKFTSNIKLSKEFVYLALFVT